MLIDIGANLTHDSFDGDRQTVLARAHEVGVRQMVVTGASLEGSDQALALATQHDGLYATAGIHPHHAEQTTEDAIDHLEGLASHERVKAIGETGLDFFRNFSPRKDQLVSFEAHLALAARTGLPCFLHERDAHPSFAEVLPSPPLLDPKIPHKTP